MDAAAGDHSDQQPHEEQQLSGSAPQPAAVPFVPTPAPPAGFHPSNVEQAATTDEAAYSSHAASPLLTSCSNNSYTTPASIEAAGGTDQSPPADSFTFAPPVSPSSSISTPAPTLAQPVPATEPAHTPESKDAQAHATGARATRKRWCHTRKRWFDEEQAPSQGQAPVPADELQQQQEQELQQLSVIDQEYDLDPHQEQQQEQQQQQQQPLAQHQSAAAFEGSQLHMSHNSLQSSADLQLSSMPGTPHSLRTGDTAAPSPYSSHGTLRSLRTGDTAAPSPYSGHLQSSTEDLQLSSMSGTPRPLKAGDVAAPSPYSSHLQSSTEDPQLSSMPDTLCSFRTGNTAAPSPYSSHSSISNAPSHISVPPASQPQSPDASFTSSVISATLHPAQGLHPTALRGSSSSQPHPQAAPPRVSFTPSDKPSVQLPPSPGSQRSSLPSPSAPSSSTLSPPSLDMAFRSPAQSQEWSPIDMAKRLPPEARPPWNSGPGVRDSPSRKQTVLDGSIAPVVHYPGVHSHGPHGKERKKTLRRSRASPFPLKLPQWMQTCRSQASRASSSSSRLTASVDHAFPPGTTLTDVLAYQQVQLSQSMQQQLQASRDRQEQPMQWAELQDRQQEQWIRQQRDHQQQQQYRPSQYPFLSQHRPMSGYTYEPTDAEERRQKHALYASRAGLARDIKLQRASARVQKDEYARLAQEAASLDRSLDSFSQGLVEPKVVQSRLKSLRSRLQHLSKETPLINHDALPQREITVEGDGSSGPSASQAELLLRVLDLVKQLQPEQAHESVPPTFSVKQPEQAYEGAPPPFPSSAPEESSPGHPDFLFPAASAAYAPRPQTAPAPTRGASNWGHHADISHSVDMGNKQQVEQSYARERLVYVGTPKQASKAPKVATAAEADPGSSKGAERVRDVEGEKQRVQQREEQSTEQAQPIEHETEQEAQDAPASPPPGTKITLNPRGRGEVSVVVPVRYSMMGSHERRKYADAQLERPPNYGPVHEVYEAARRPVPHFEGTPERTHMRLRWSPSTPYWEKPEVLRRAEDWEEDQKQRALALQHPRFHALSEEEANEVLDEEAAEEEQALRLAGHRTRQLEREERAAWARHLHPTYLCYTHACVSSWVPPLIPGNVCFL
ncbi:hypothetical protein DUNSADRAFT_4728 [Dunaliella salina]|uniref:Uncharacterized protein n=1 Tax=Dunaliella salina TaxID=3046 RepID=A0ABQ7H7K6_DUNSA|nr:hypothetical protein DUNSADRAFT_4728 [Dunaliella salina]|eukprot:KAF5842844.1 hypothetical protein DUNSADRAFT_4728 [Dunaliella salina]